MTTVFQLYLLINYQSLHDYPYIAISDESDLLISICPEHISIDKREDAALFSEADYVATSRFIEVEIDRILRLVELYLGTDECSIIARFTEDKHVTFTYRVAPPNCRRIHDLYDDGSNMTAVTVVTKLMVIMEAIRQAADTIDD